MNKQQFIEKSKPEVEQLIWKIMVGCATGNIEPKEKDKFVDEIVSKLSQCWDIAGEEGLPKEIPKCVSQIALEESLKLQAHYAQLLNDWDGGSRTIFRSVSQWLSRLKETGTFDSLTSKQEDKK